MLALAFPGPWAEPCPSKTAREMDLEASGWED